MDDDTTAAVLAVLQNILDVVNGLAAELERYRALLPEPGTIRAKLLTRKVGASAVDHWNEAS